jgi:hypothetical protein
MSAISTMGKSLVELFIIIHNSMKVLSDAVY